jgi:hypothetical protein
MKNDLEEIIQRLDALTAAIENNTREIKKIRLQLFGKKRERPKTASITFPTWCYEYESMTIHLDAKQWKAVKEGKVITVRGQGEDISEYIGENKPFIEWDYWTFNKKSPGHVSVVMQADDMEWEAETAYDGNLEDCLINETEVTPKRKAKAK